LLALLSCVSAGVAGCNSLLDIDHIEFGDPGAGAVGGAAVGGSGGTGAVGGVGANGAGGVGADGGQGGTPPPYDCDDGIHNGFEEGIDCGGPDCEPCAENCTNGQDDNGDQLVDCEDPICGAHQCYEAPGNPWWGPVALYVGGGVVTTCTPGWPDATPGGVGTVDAPDATCSACSCGNVTGASCGVPGVSFWASNGCGSSLGTVTPPAADVCQPVSVGVDASSMGADVPVQPGTCPASGGAATIPEASYEQEALLCEGAEEGAGCADPTSVCVRPPVYPFHQSICIVRNANHTCPSGPYTERTVVYQTLLDTRDCTVCSCSVPTGVSCTGTTTLFSDGSCSSSTATVPHDGSSCVSHPTTGSMRFTIDSGPSGGSCTTGGGAPTGSATGTDPLTVCCLP
jgi:hypothetical protein